MPEDNEHNEENEAQESFRDLLEGLTVPMSDALCEPERRIFYLRKLRGHQMWQLEHACLLLLNPMDFMNVVDVREHGIYEDAVAEIALNRADDSVGLIATEANGTWYVVPSDFVKWVDSRKGPDGRRLYEWLPQYVRNGLEAPPSNLPKDAVKILQAIVDGYKTAAEIGARLGVCVRTAGNRIRPLRIAGLVQGKLGKSGGYTVTQAGRDLLEKVE